MLARSRHELTPAPLPESISSGIGGSTEEKIVPIERAPLLTKLPGPRIIGEGICEGHAGVPSSFSVYADDQGKLEVGVEGEHTVDVAIEKEKDSFRVNYLAPHPGIYKFSTTFNGNSVDGSPLEVRSESGIQRA